MTQDTGSRDRLDPLRHMLAEILDLDMADIPHPGSFPGSGLPKRNGRTGPPRDEARIEQRRAIARARAREELRSPRVNRKLPVQEQACQCCGANFQPTRRYRLLCARCRAGKGPQRMCPYNPQTGFVR